MTHLATKTPTKVQFGRKKLGTALILALTMPLMSACANFGGTPHSGEYIGQSFAGVQANPGPVVLRSAPLPAYVFDYHDNGDAALNHALFQRRFGTQAAHVFPRYSPNIIQAPSTRQPLEEAVGRFTPEPAFKTAPIAAAQDSADISFVKEGGGSNYADWQACENQAGGAFIDIGGRFGLKPEFEQCMRSRGYRPEGEVIAAFESSPSSY